jgi:hypothetical protein
MTALKSFHEESIVIGGLNSGLPMTDHLVRVTGSYMEEIC